MFLRLAMWPGVERDELGAWAIAGAHERSRKQRTMARRIFDSSA